ncbi:MAG: efflux RND transporter periplasmic adaptor subunit [Hyphomicrobiaceae bacterium]
MSFDYGRALFSVLPALAVALTSIAASAQTGATQSTNRQGASGSIRGVTRAEAAATISSELVARIVELPFKVGQAFSKDDILIRFDCQRYEADLEAAVADVSAQQIHAETNRQLLRHRATGANDLALAEAKLAQAVATAKSIRVRTRQCTISAPYDGRIVERLVDVFEMPASNAPLVKIVRVGAIEIDLIVPSNWSPSLASGQRFTFAVDETGSVHDAILLNVGAIIDPVSRTLRVTARLPDPGLMLRPGMSGVAQRVIDAQARNP